MDVHKLKTSEEETEFGITCVLLMVHIHVGISAHFCSSASKETRNLFHRCSEVFSMQRGRLVSPGKGFRLP